MTQESGPGVRTVTTRPDPFCQEMGAAPISKEAAAV
jgi:hypothetical protein